MRDCWSIDVPGILGADPHRSFDQSIFSGPLLCSLPERLIVQRLFQHFDREWSHAAHPPNNVQQDLLDPRADIHIAHVCDVHQYGHYPFEIRDIGICVVRDDLEQALRQE